MLTACAPAGDSDSPADSGGPVTLTVWHYATQDEQLDVLDQYKTMFEENNDGVTVENVYVPYDQLNSKLISSAGAQTGPDVVVFNGAEASILALGGALAPMTEQWDGFADKDQLPESVVHIVEEETYAAQGYVSLLGLWYNSDLLAEIGVEPPTTMDELNDAMDAAVAAGKQGITLSGRPQSQGEWQAYPWLTSFGFDYADPQAEPLEEAFTMVQEWTETGALSKEAATWDQTVPFQTWAAGNVAFAENGNWQLGAVDDAADFEYGVVPMPLGDDGQVYLGGEGQGIGAFSENPDVAWNYLEETYFSPEGQQIALTTAGSLPSRADAADDDAIAADPILAAFASSITDLGANYPSTAVPAESVADQQLSVGQTWSAVISGQTSPSDAADELIDTLTPLLGR
ncbi:sugar ABC transporter substrate-binding protein [Marisediminicola senii]|uniref:sugar ABC transporter substrate-binding protein n=1 Tax=Marisediminicola senii TaxID=2711233 RepID=UPI0013EA242C|nr:extracellular solute-binding protein [Marisediminicola senii]